MMCVVKRAIDDDAENLACRAAQCLLHLRANAEHNTVTMRIKKAI